MLYVLSGKLALYALPGGSCVTTWTLPSWDVDEDPPLPFTKTFFYSCMVVLMYN
jgi:hypothetical protein